MRVALLVVAALVMAGCAEEGDAPPLDATACELAPGDAEPAWKAERPRVALATSAGDIVVELESERAPLTVASFLNLSRSGFYDGVLFHRVIKGFVVQSGDPLSKDDDPRNDGTGGPGYKIPDEFHPALRHDAAGVLSMANSGPNTGGSQFFVTLGPAPHLDDRHTVFGRVVSGMDVVRAIGDAQVDPDDRPIEPIRLVNATILEPAPQPPAVGVGAHVVIASKKAEPARPVTFAVVLKNEGATRDRLALAADAPEGWSCRADAPVEVPAGTARVAFLTLTPARDAAGSAAVPVRVESARGATAMTNLTVEIAELGAQVVSGQKVVAHYAGLLPDGRLFDTSLEAVARDPAQPKFETPGGYQESPSYSSFPFTVGSGVIPGFTKLALTAKVGETVTGSIPAKDAYASGNPYEFPLAGRDLVFELEIVSLG